MNKPKSFPARSSSLAAVRDFAREQATASGVSPEQREEVAAAVERAFASAFSRRSAQPLEVRVRVLGDSIEVEFMPGSSREGEPSQDRWTGSFAVWLSKELRERGLSQEAAARRIGVSLKTVSRWVRGETEPRFRELALIQGAFGKQPLVLREESDGER